MSISRPPSYEEAVQGNGQRSSHSNNIPGGPLRNVSVSSRDSRVDADMHKEEKKEASLRRASISSVDSVEDRQRDLLQHDRAASLAISRPPQLERWEDNPLRVEDVGYDPLFSPVEGKQQGEKRDSGQGRAQAISVAYISFGPSPVAVDLHEGIMDDRQKRPSIIYRMHAARVNEYEEQQLSSFPAFTLLVVIIDVVLFIITMGENNWSFEAYSVNPMFGPSSATEIKMGAKLTSRILGGDWYRLIAPMFLHAGLIHLLLNMMVMWRMAKDFEESFGTIRISIIFLASGVFGTLLSAIFVPDMIGVGASGALYGLLGASWGDLFHNWHYITHGRNWYIIRLTISSIGGLVIGLLPYIDNFAHIGGWVCGVVAGSAIMIGSMRDPIDGRRRYKNKLLFIISTALCVAMFIIAISVLYGRADVNKWCSWCHYLDCVDTRWWDCSQQYAQACTMYNGTIVECHPL